MMGDIKQIHRARLVAFFGDAGASVILDHFGDLERTFGSASNIIFRVMEGEYHQEVEKR
jgi:hypothetical protein